MSRRWSLCSVFVFACAAACVRPAQFSSHALDARTTAAYACLAHAESFSDDAVGDGGETPREVIALRILWTASDAPALFERLLDEAPLGGRMYALCGLYYADSRAFDRAAAQLRTTRATLTYRTGCEILNDYPAADLIANPRADVVRLERRDQSIKEWRAKRTERCGYVLDIVGGGYPNLFREAGGYATVLPQALEPER